MPVLRFPHIPTRFASRGWLTVPRGAAQPVNAPETPTVSPALRPLPLALSSVGRAARRYLHDSALFCRKQTAAERSGAIAPPASEAGVSWPNEDEIDDHRSSDDTNSRGTGRLHGGAAHSARRAGTMGTVNAPDVVTVHHLVKRYGHVLAVNDVSFSIREGEIFGIIGPNGAGKTTSVECISGLRAPDAGE